MKRSIVLGFLVLMALSSVFALPAITGDLVVSGRCLTIHPNGNTSEYWGVGPITAILYMGNVPIVTHSSGVWTGGSYAICTQNLSHQMAQLITKIVVSYDGKTVTFENFSISNPVSYDFIRYDPGTPYDPRPWIPKFN
jgi:hypothetical protein